MAVFIKLCTKEFCVSLKQNFGFLFLYHSFILQIQKEN